MPTTWILVANASTARLFARERANQPLQLLQEFSHPESREKGSGLASDRPGHSQAMGGMGRGSFVQETDPKDYEAERFSRELAQVLDEGRTGNHYDQLILVAPAHFQGLLGKALDRQVQKLLISHIEKDYTRETERDLLGHLQAQLA